MKRLTIAISTSRELVLNQKKLFEQLHGKKLSWDDFFKLQSQRIDLPAARTIVNDVKQQLGGLGRHLETNREAPAAGIVEVFGDAIIDVLEGKLQPATLMSAIVGATDDHVKFREP